MKKRNKIIIISLIIIFILISIIIGGYFLLNKKETKTNTPLIINEIKDYNYKLKDNDSKIYKDLFKELKKVLDNKEVNEEEYVKLISKMFIIDFYTLDNKIDNTDIGGEMFLEESIISNFKLKASETLYKYVESDIYHDRVQELPIVSDVVIDKVETIKFLEDLKAFKVECSIKYVKDLKYKDKTSLIFIHKDKKLVLVEII
ncbi:MAG: hypothetical protein RR161_03615 [Bacilli bacterium]